MNNNLEIMKICLEEAGNAKDKIHNAFKSKDPETHLADGLCSLIRIESELRLSIAELEQENLLMADLKGMH